TPGQIVVVDCEGDPDNIDKSTLVFRGSGRPTEQLVAAGVDSSADGNSGSGQE
ncbi:AAA family ATPase, partial [Micromonospora sp. CPCC 206060]